MNYSTMNRLYQLLLLLLIGAWLSPVSQAQTTATNVRLRTDPTVRKVIVEYELSQMLPDDSIYLELETASGRILRPTSVNGDVGTAIKPGKNKVIAWDVVRDNVRINEDVKVLLRVARMATVASPATVAAAPVRTTPAPTTTRPTVERATEPGSVVRKSPLIPIIGWAATGVLAGYATVLALGLNKDVKEYNAKPFADDATDLQRYKDLKSRIDSHKSTFTIVAGAAAAVAIGNVIYMLVSKPKSTRTSLLIQPGNQVTSVGLIRQF